MELSDYHWSLIEPLLPVWQPCPKGGGRRPPYSTRVILEKILWVCRSGARWKDISRAENEPSYQTCHRWFQNWNSEGVWFHVLQVLSQDLVDEKVTDPKKQIIDGSFAPAKKGA